MSVTATLYSLTLADISNNETLSNYFTSGKFSPYNNDFSEINQYKKPNINFNCDLSLTNNTYTLTVTHMGLDNSSKKDLEITFPKDYVLNFNVIHAQNDLFSIIREKDSVVKRTFVNSTQEGNVNKKVLPIDTGVYLTLANDVTFGRNEIFSLKRNKIHVKMIDDNNYPYNNSGWGDVSGGVNVYRPIVLTNGSLTIANPSSGVNKTKSIILNAVRGYDVANNIITINRTPATYTFTLDVSFANPIVTLNELYDSSAVYIDMCNNNTYTNGNFSITYPRPINRYDLSWNNANNWSQGLDLCNNNLNLTPQNRYIRSKLNIYRYQFDSPLDSTPQLNQNAHGIDFGNATTIDTKIYTFARNGLADGIENMSNKAFGNKNYHEDGDSGSQYTPVDKLLAASDSSYNYTYEKMTYTQIWSAANGEFIINNLKSSPITDSDTDTTRWKSNKLTPLNGSNYVFLDIGLKVNVKQSVLASDEPKNYNLTVVPAVYNYSFQNPTKSIDISGSGTLFDGIITNFLDFRTRSIKPKFPTKIELSYNSSLLRVYKNDSYTGNPSSFTSWEEIPTSPFFPDVDGVKRFFTLHPTNLNAPYGFTLEKLANSGDSWDCYLVVAPPSFCVEYNSLKSTITNLPFIQSSNIVKNEKIYVDVKKNGDVYNLFNLVNDTGKISNKIDITPPSTVTLYKLKTQSSNVAKNIIINGNYIELTLYNGLNGKSSINENVDGSLNVVTNSNNNITNYTYDIFDNPSDNKIETIYSRKIINDLIVSTVGSKYQASLSSNSVKYDVTYSQELNKLFNITNDTLNIHFTIDNAFIPTNVSYLPLSTSKSTSATFYDSRINYNNGKYYVVLNKYMLGDGDSYAGVDYNSLLTGNSNINEVAFRINSRAQKVIELYMYDTSNNRRVLNNVNLSDARYVSDLLGNLTADDISGAKWVNKNSALNKVGISFAALDNDGRIGLQKLLKFDAAERIDNKTLFIERNDILRVNSIVGQPVFRITNSGNLITNKVSTTMLSLLQQSVSIANRGYYGTNDVKNGGVENPIANGLFSLNSLDFSGNWLDGTNQNA
jgi:hypothetical protein